MKPTEKIIN